MRSQRQTNKTRWKEKDQNCGYDKLLCAFVTIKNKFNFDIDTEMD